MTEAIGDSAWLHSTRAAFKVTVQRTGVSHTGHFSLASCPEIEVYTKSRALARLAGPLKVSVKGPASPSKATEATVVVAPTDNSAWPTGRLETAQAPHSVDLSSSLYLNQQFLDLHFHESINYQLKPLPLVGRQPEIVWSYDVTGGATTDSVSIEISGVLELSGVDYVSPW